ncbi:MAG: cofactor-independent phosphoglycerate mutase [Candidatus Omnitrophica bacterium]|nr:cofactor-independent phosphoglycerate mutase [Candidatus Omnitrophota bacterium]
MTEIAQNDMENFLMKYLLIIGDGMADYPIPELNWKTPLEAASTPQMDSLARNQAILGMVRTIPRGVKAASDTAFLSILGCDPREYHPGRGPLEAINLGIDLQDKEVAFRVNLVTLSEKKMADYSAGHITDEEATTLITLLQKNFSSEGIFFYPGKSYRNIMVFKNPAFDWRKLITVPPHDILDKEVTAYLPRGDGDKILLNLMERAGELLSNHPINKTRVDLAENPANNIWPWGQGEKARLPLFRERFGGLKGVTVSEVDIVKGIGKAVGLEALSGTGWTGYLDTNYQGMVNAAIAALKTVDFAVLHIEAPDETSHSGETKLKIKAIIDFDRKVVGPAVSALQAEFPESRVMVMSDHITSLRQKTHTPDPVPFLIAGTGVHGKGAPVFSEKQAAASRIYVKEGWKIINFFFNPWSK